MQTFEGPLDREHFETLHVENRDGFDYHVIRPRDSTMILFSSDGYPLAALGIRCQTTSEQNDALCTRGRAFIAKSPKSLTAAHYRGIVTKDNQDIEFIISNLCPLNGVKIDIMHRNVAVEDTDPGAAKGALNEINELSALSSAVIQGDQADSRSLVLSAIKMAGGAKLTVGESEKQAAAAPLGTYFYLSVTPKNEGQEFIDRFKSSYWDVRDFFVLRTPHRRAPERVVRGNPYLLSARSVSDVDYGPGVFEGYSKTMSMECCSMESASRGEARASVASVNSAFWAGPPRTEEPMPQMALIQTNSEAEMTDLVNTSYAANVAAGRHVNTSGRKTGWTYYYDVPSNKTGQLCTLCLSISTQVKVLPPMPGAEIAEAGKLLIPELIDKGNAALLKAVTQFVEDKCVICQEDGGVDTVFVQCGHRCTHFACLTDVLTKCPLCRKHVVSAIRVTDSS